MTHKDPTIKVSAGKPPVTRLNRKLIIALSGVAAIIVIFILFSSLSDNSSGRNQFRGKLPSTTVQSTEPAQTVENLPAGYQDAKKINALLHKNQPKVVDKLPAEVQAELARLRSKQAELEAKLSNLSHHPSTPIERPAAPLSAMDREAMSSSIFFVGGTPKPASAQNKQKELAGAKGLPQQNVMGNKDKSSDYDKQNMQAQKLKFLKQTPSTQIYNTNTLSEPVSKYLIQAGTAIPAILQSKIVSNQPGMIVALVSRDVYDSLNGNYLLIPKGSKLIGKYNSQVAYGQDQVQAVFTRLIRPDGSSIVLPNAQAVNAMGVSGLKDEVDNHWWRIIGSAFLSSVFALPSIVATNQLYANTGYVNGNNSSFVSPNVGQLAGASALQSAAQGVQNIGNNIAQRSLNLQPTLVINAGYQFSVMVAKDMILKPYQMPENEVIPQVL